MPSTLSFPGKVRVALTSSDDGIPQHMRSHRRLGIKVTQVHDESERLVSW